MADVLERFAYALEQRGTEAYREIILQSIRDSIERFLKEVLPGGVGMNEMEKFAEHHIKTFGFEEVCYGLSSLVNAIPLGRKCRVVFDYDPTARDATVTTFIDKSDGRRAQDKLIQGILGDSKKE